MNEGNPLDSSRDPTAPAGTEEPDQRHGTPYLGRGSPQGDFQGQTQGAQSRTAYRHVKVTTEELSNESSGHPLNQHATFGDNAAYSPRQPGQKLVAPENGEYGE